MGKEPHDDAGALRSVTVPVALSLGAIVAAAWYITGTTGDLTMSLLAMPETMDSAPRMALAFAVIMVMMVAMMLPPALPMIVTFHRLTRTKEVQAAKPWDGAGTLVFAIPYFVAWGALGFVVLLVFSTLGFRGPLSGSLVLLPAIVVAGAGVYQLTRTKEACLRHCQSPLGFVMIHWKQGRRGAVRMGFEHAGYCIGCCWLLMLVLFLVGTMNLLWMGFISVTIFLEKVGPGRPFVSRAVGILLVLLGVFIAAQGILPP